MDGRRSRERRARARAAAVACAILAVALGCAIPPVSPIPTAIAPTPIANPWRAPEAIEAAREFRRTLGHRSDDLWIERVAADPASLASLESFDVLLLPIEVTELMARTSAAVYVGVVIAEYGRTVPDDWHGSFIDQQRGSTVVVEVYRNTDLHRASLSKLLSPMARWEVRQVDQRVFDQIALVDRVKADAAWFATIDAELLDVVTNPMYGGIVELTYKAEQQDLDDRIRDHFGDHDWLRVEWAGFPPWTGPVGDLVILAVDAEGAPIPGLLCSFGSTGIVTAADGTCRYQRVPAKEGHVQLIALDVEPGYTAGSATYTVRPNQRTIVRIVVELR